MNRSFNKYPEWTIQQKEILDAIPNIIISGCAGSGKTQLACHLAIKYSDSLKVAILVYTKSLRTFIKEYIESLTNNNITIFYEHEWKSRNYPKFDIIIVDEYQDFSLKDIENVINYSNLGVYLFGDEQQKLYKKNYYHEKTITTKELESFTKMKRIRLKENFRISMENKNFIKSIFINKSLDNANFHTETKPQILHFNTADDEINWLTSFIKDNKTFKTIGVLLKQNDGFKGGYYYCQRKRIEKIWGILELHKHFTQNRICSGYKYYSNDNLDFLKEVNIMTVHSSKGLQFDCVILPFSNYANENNGNNSLPYVGLTRAINSIIISYSGLIADEYAFNINRENYVGKIRKKTKKDNIPLKEYVKSIINENFKDTPGFKTYNVDEEQMDASDCDKFRH
jgi:superfamily I DNA/RNA helicase